ncbi:MULTISPECIES: MCE family protein [unclassified Mycolicibacterium]|uniref:MCE family protein n=1 Tax=unclassified Mycolicibacterium TaxID=2636767 RepID=UPI0012DEDF0E|nr:MULTISPECIES: MlaD family protein [unclassified Mycolicibacterium]MUL83415.1 MCE family protein [Mycolicibacterium sp. CBMA 329]MUL90406.1 MCE family protein [Mycolicibacterium sp. CBMA 331]MUM00379.1 MCE family protein [Mycolicibacterium sp. CBMA 334]MUM29790.1 MCE family protein [Mycolicibacterium sp. CBMA 295]MUM41350.1 MCE family protein [Mycolicibacterium sp. CBMA 247]
MLTRFIRTQLILFTVASVVGVAVMLFGYMQVPTLLGVGRITVKLELPASGGLYQFGNVTYRGSQIGKVTSVELTDKGAEATLSLDRSPKVPADLAAEVRSMSAVGEQYVELLPRTSSGPYLADGSVIAVSNTKVPQQVGPMLDQLSALMDTIPKDKLSQLLDESYEAFNGTGYDFGSLLDSASTITRDANAVSDHTRALIDDSKPFLDAQAQTTDSIRTWAASLAGITGQIADNDPEVRSLLRNGPGFAQETTKLLEQIKPTLPVLLANLSTFGQIAVTYNPSIEQLLVLLPPYVSQIQTYAPTNNPTGLPNGEFSLGLGDPPACTVGFLPPSAWRSPSDTTVIDTPDNIYCKLPQDSPIGVRGARNYPCMGHPGKRAPTVELCNDPRGFQPIAQREHALGPYPLDPNLIAQGVPPDNRVLPDEHIYGPLQGTPLPPGVAAPPPGAAPEPRPAPSFAGTGPGPLLPGQPLYLEPPVPGVPPPPAADRAAVPLPPADLPQATEVPSVTHGEGLPPGPPGAPGVAPSAFNGGAGHGPSVAIAKYNPRTGEYMGSDGNLYRQTDLVSTPKSWQDLMPT